ncbi:LuxR C-terminal-related transcriptional regulator [Actinomycetospora termitidis]|uniref:LuxR C-terminal-related transcriptional regulator n=1 Tax=Actinomycetospora termitidis TaxID=3053470 RepID=A0ABT7M805_9PSEU|nr:LuxR C-terminal-related transcriptional regulator [Actinomycetospora sp. Odt1-22]MDL5156581.1 LuxR C-terminal-related transcriptional regulator [Actinomycetospora sp. Odt1-22]
MGVLVGRDDDMAFLLDAWSETRRGARSIVLLGGEAGIGRTELVATFTERVRADGVDAVVAQAVTVAGQRPCWTVVAALRRRLGLADDEVDPGAVLTGVGDLLSRLARSGPTVLVVEDLHLGDSSYTDLLDYLLAEPDRGSLLVVATYRTEVARRLPGLSTVLARLGAHRAVRPRELSPLTEPSVDELVRRSTRRDGGLSRRVWQRSCGNPAIALASIEAGDDELPVTLRALALDRLDALPDGARTVARALAVVGEPVPHGLLASMLDLGEPHLTAAVRAAVEGAVVTVDRDRYALVNGLLGEVLDGEVLPGERARLCVPLERRAAPPEHDEVLAACFAVAGRSDDDDATLAAHETLAGLLCGPLGRLDDGVALARRVLGELPEPRRSDPAALGLRAVLADALVRLGRWDEAASELDAPDVPTPRLLLVAARLVLGRGDLDAADERLAVVPGLAQTVGDTRFADDVVDLRARLALARGDRGTARRLVAQRLATGRGGAWVVAPVLCTGFRAEAGDPDPEALDRLVRRLDTLADRVDRGDPVLRSAAEAHLVLCRAEAGRAEGERRPEDWEHAAGLWWARGELPAVAYCSWRQGESMLDVGRRAAAVEVLREAERLAVSLGATGRIRGIRRTLERAGSPTTSAPDDPPLVPGIDTLTARETQVLAELSRGLTNRAIGRRLRISEKTVEVHVTHVLAKLGARSRLEASTVWHGAAACTSGPRIVPASLPRRPRGELTPGRP